MHKILYIFIAALLLCASCSTNKNTAGNRRWQAFITRYNVFYNAKTAYIEGIAAQDKADGDNYTERLPLYTVGNEKMRGLGKSNFETAITKCEKAIQLHSIKKKPVVSGNKTRTAKMKAYLSRKEFNPFLKNAWLLMGKAQFQKGDFLEAASTFSYITRFYAAEPAVVAEARIWLARCYAQLDWYYDAEDAISRLNRDTMPKRLTGERDATMAVLLARQERWEEAIPYIERVAKKSKRSAQKARAYYILGQVCQMAGKPDKAYKAFGKCIRQSPPYKMTFNARIMQTEVITDKRSAKASISRLKRMARSDNNKDYLDQVYYAMGNIYMMQRDTTQAIAAYERGRAKATRAGIEKGILLLRLGEIYWTKRKFAQARDCYSEAMGLIDKTYKNYEEVSRRSKVLDELVPHTNAVFLQDSLQALARMGEKERNAAIDRVIEALKKKEAEEKKARADSAARARAEENGTGPIDGLRPKPKLPNNAQTSATKEWYFYNQQLVSQGKQSFRQQWGNRKNEDDWRRSNKSLLAKQEHEGYNYDEDEEAAADSTLTDEARKAIEDSIKAAKEDPAQDPHKREYYLAQIPFTPEQVAASDLLIMDGLYNAGIIEKDKLEDFELAAETLGRLERQYKDFEKMDDVYYQLFLLYSRWKKTDQASYYRTLLAREYPDGKMTRIVNAPDFEYIARYGREIEDSLYRTTYQAYCDRNLERVKSNFALSTNKFPLGTNRPKFIFVHALARIGVEPSDTIAAELRRLATEYPKSDVSNLAAMIVKGLESGRTLTKGGLSVSDIWSRRNTEAQKDAASQNEGSTLKPDRDVPYTFLIAYPTDSINDDQLLYDLAHFNFTSFMLRGFDLQKERNQVITTFSVTGFGNYDEVHAYVQRIYRDEHLRSTLQKCRVEIISDQNLKLLGSLYSFDEYRKFYDANYAPLEINPELPLEYEPELTPDQHYEDEVVPASGDNEQDDDEVFDEEFDEVFDEIIETPTTVEQPKPSPTPQGTGDETQKSDADQASSSKPDSTLTAEPKVSADSAANPLTPKPKRLDGGTGRGLLGKSAKDNRLNPLTPARNPLVPTETDSPLNTEEKPAVKEEVPAVKEEVPAVKEEVPASKEEVPAVKEEVPAVKEEVPVVNEEVPVVNEEDDEIIIDDPTTSDPDEEEFIEEETSATESTSEEEYAE